jgi:hypothetical protein
VLDRLRFTMPSVALIWADGGYAGQFVTWAKRLLKVTVEIVRKPTGIRTATNPQPKPPGVALQRVNLDAGL